MLDAKECFERKFGFILSFNLLKYIYILSKNSHEKLSR